VADPAAVTELATYAGRRRTRVSAAAEAAERSQALYERVASKAASARRRDFIQTLEQGVSVEELAEVVGLDAQDVRTIVGC
jgi:predicted transcriptional regulator